MQINPAHHMMHSNFLDKIFHSAVGKLLIVILQTILVSLVLLIVFFARVFGDILLLKYAIVLAVGLMAGFSARVFLTGYTQLLKMLAASLSAALSLVMMYTLSKGFIGINLFYPTSSRPDWESLIQFAVAVIGALLVLYAFTSRLWQKADPDYVHQPRVAPTRTRIKGDAWLPTLNLPSGQQIRHLIQKISRNTPDPISVGKPRGKKNETTSKKLKLPGKMTRSEKRSRGPTPILKGIKPVKQTRRPSKKEIKLIGKQEHICPYCLDPVDEHDSRGVKICSVCKTRHHADCWGITGACQIPHSQE